MIVISATSMGVNIRKRICLSLVSASTFTAYYYCYSYSYNYYWYCNSYWCVYCYYPRGPIYATIMELGSERLSLYWLWGPNCSIAVYTCINVYNIHIYICICIWTLLVLLLSLFLFPLPTCATIGLASRCIARTIIYEWLQRTLILQNH